MHAFYGMIIFVICSFFPSASMFALIGKFLLYVPIFSVVCMYHFLPCFIGCDNVEEGHMAVMKQLQVLLQDYVW
jgi:hypothetical protein